MNSVPRKLTVGLGLALVAAACGDDVTVQEQPQPTPVVRSVVVSPSSATVAPGGSFTFGAAVDADAGLARTVTWSSSNTTVANVDQSGVATASATLSAGGVTSVCAASTADANVKGCAQLTVTPAAAPATVEINAITIGCDALSVVLSPVGCGLLAPVATNNVFGQFDVQVNINRPAQNSGITGVILEVINAATNAVEATETQTLTNDIGGDADGLALQQGTLNNVVTFSVQSASYSLNASGAGVVKHTNGQKKIRVRLVGGSATATAETQLTFRNVDGFHVTATDPSGNNAAGAAVRQNSAAGFAWRGGTPLTIGATPISYTGRTLASATVNFGSGLCDQSGTGNRAAAATAASGVWSATLGFTNGAAGAGGNLNAYELAPGIAACVNLGELPGANGIDNTGSNFIQFPLGGAFGAFNTLNNPFGPVVPTLGTTPAFRIDNRGPAAIAGYTVNPNGRAFGWFNDAVVMDVRTATNVNGVIAGATPADAGIGGTVTFQARAGVCNSVATCATQAIMSGPTTLAESATGASYAMIVQTLDLFRNFTNPAGINTFGVDRTLPTVAAAGGAAANAIIANQGGAVTFANVNAGASTWSAQDATATVGAIPSGIVGPNNVRVINQRRDGASSQFWCPPNAQFQPAAGACPGATGWATGTQRFVQAAGVISADPSLANADAYYGLVVDAVDNAGNIANAVTRNVINDVLVGGPAAFGANFLPAIIPATGTTQFNGSATENLDLARAHFGVNYPALTSGATFIRFPFVTTGSGAAPGGTTPTGFNFAGPSILSTNPPFAATAAVLRSIEQATGGNAIDVTGTNAGTAINGFQYQAWDVARNVSNVVAPVVGFGASGLVAGPAAWATAAGAAPFNTLTWLVCGQGAGPAPCAAVAGNVDLSGNAAGGNVNSRTLQAIATSALNPFQAPFLGGVTFYVLDAFQNAAFGAPAGSAWVPACTAGSPVNDQATNTWIYSCTYTPSGLRVSHDFFGFNETNGTQAAIAGGTLVPVIAVGMNLTGNGLATNAFTYAHQN